MKILFLTIDSFGGHGGIAQYDCDVVRALSLQSDVNRVDVVALHANHAFDRLPSKTAFFCSRGNRAIYSLQMLKRCVSGTAYDLILCGHVHLLPMAALARSLCRAPILLFIYGIDAWKPTKNWLKLLYPLIEGVISISRLTLDRFFEWSGLHHKPHAILPNCVDSKRFCPGPKDPELMDRFNLHDKKVLLTFGRLVSQERYKGFDEVLNVLPGLLKKIPNLVYLIAGTGDDKARLKNRAEQLSLENHVIFTGYIAEDQKVGLYRCADLYLMPSRGEGFGFVLIEAAACGIPVLGSTIDGTREALRNGELGQLVHPDNQRDLVHAIENGLAQTERKAPEGLQIFSFPRFTATLAGFIHKSLGCQ